MKKTLYLFIYIALCICFTSCIETKKEVEKERIYVSIAPIKPLVEAIVGDDFDIEILVPAGASPETFEPTAKQFVDLNKLGAVVTKGVANIPWEGNATPRVAEVYGGMLNAVGLQNPGVEKVISEELPKLKRCFNKPVMANVSGFSVEDYVYACEKLDKEDQVGILEVNVSCPNVHNGGMSFGTLPESAAEVTKAVKAVTTKPVYIKLSPNVTNIVDMAKGKSVYDFNNSPIVSSFASTPRYSEIKNDFGGVDILLPKGVNVKVDSNAVFYSFRPLRVLPRHSFLLRWQPC